MSRKQFSKEFPYQIFKIPQNASSATQVIDIAGYAVTLLNPIAGSVLISFDDLEQKFPIPMLPLQTYKHKFERLAIKLDNTKMSYLILIHTNPDFEILNWSNFWSYNINEIAPGNNEEPEYGIRGVYVETFGNIVIYDLGNGIRTIANIPGGTFLPIDFLRLVSTTTSVVHLMELEPLSPIAGSIFD